MKVLVEQESGLRINDWNFPPILRLSGLRSGFQNSLLCRLSFIQFKKNGATVHLTCRRRSGSIYSTFKFHLHPLAVSCVPVASVPVVFGLNAKAELIQTPAGFSMT